MELTEKDYIKNLKNAYNLKKFFTKQELLEPQNKKRKKKWIKQRIKRGFASCDLFNFDSFLLHILINGLQEFAQDIDTYPTDFNSLEEWQQYLFNVRQDFVDALVYSQTYTDHYEENIQKSYKALSDGFDKLKQHFFGLWN